MVLKKYIRVFPQVPKLLATQDLNKPLLYHQAYLQLQLKHGERRVEENLLMVCGEMEEKVDTALEMQMFRLDPLFI